MKVFGKTKLLLLLLVSQFSFSQGEGNIWYFGQNAGLNFSSGTPQYLLDGQLNTIEGCATISTPEGQLLFYTDGVTVWNKNHQIMLNGENLLGHASSSQSAVIVPKPGSSTIYYIITTPEKGNAVGARYSVVDMSLGSGLGGITNVKNILLKTPVCEKIAVVKKNNNSDYWVVFHGYGNNSFYSYSVTEAGIDLTPVTNNIGSVVAGNENYALGYLKFSSDGSKLVCCNLDLSVELFDFDLSSGLMSNVKQVGTATSYYGAEFSSSGDILYLTGGGFYKNKVFQYDLRVNDINSSEIVLYNTGVSETEFGALQLGPDGKIYLSRVNRSFLGVIDNPEIYGVGCDFQYNGVSLGAKLGSAGLPQFVQSYLVPTITVDGLCHGSQSQFSLNSSIVPLMVNWDFGDGGTSSDPYPVHQYNLPGEYLVTVTITTAIGGTISKSKSIKIIAEPVANNIPMQYLCGDTGQNLNLTQFNNLILGNQSSLNFGIAYFSSLINAQNHINFLPNNVSLSLGNNVFFVKVYNYLDANCYSITPLVIYLNKLPVIFSSKDLIICDEGSEIDYGIFNLQENFPLIIGNQSTIDFLVSYHLSQADADINSNALPFSYQNVSNPQTIYIRVENVHNPNCYITSSFQIAVSKQPVANSLQNLFLCDGIENDGSERFDLEPLKAQILGGQLIDDFLISFYETETNALVGYQPLGNSFINTSNPQLLFARIENVNNPDCFETTSFQLKVEMKPEIIMQDTYVICEENPITIIAPIGFSSYQWSNGSTTFSTIVEQKGNYSLTITQDYDDIKCSATKGVEVFNSNIATITKIITNDWTDNQNSITIEVSGDGDYEYSLNGNGYQNSNSFTDLSSGDYTVCINDKKGCGYVCEDVFLLNYPKFFTPNGDGYNDFWRIKYSSIEPNMQLKIFDRYGKLLSVFGSLDLGWDGIYNGYLLPADDYWFIVKRQNGKEFKGHFALKR